MDASAMLLLGILGGAPNLPDYHLLQQHLTHNIVLQVWGVGGRGKVGRDEAGCGRSGRDVVIREGTGMVVWCPLCPLCPSHVRGSSHAGGKSFQPAYEVPRAWLGGVSVFTQHPAAMATLSVCTGGDSPLSV